MTTTQEQKAKRVAIAIAAGAAAILAGQAIATGEPIFAPDCHGASKLACAEQAGRN